MAATKVHESTTMMLDIRNFTPNLLDSKKSPRGKPYFCGFLEQFLNTCFDCILCAMPENHDGKPPVYVNSTGDGMLAVFYSQNHAVEAYLAGILIFLKLKPQCHAYNARRRKSIPAVSFGIGIESGHVCPVRTDKKHHDKGLFIETYIGNAINIAARVEQVNKTIDRTNMIIAEQTNQLLCERLFGVDYNNLVRQTRDKAATEERRRAAHVKMNELNFELLHEYVSRQIFRGVKDARPIYRMSTSLADPAREKFKDLVRDHLTGGDPKHYTRVMKLLDSE